MTAMEMDEKRTGPGVGAAILAFVIFAVIVAGSVMLSRRNFEVKGDFAPTGDFKESADGSKVEMVTVMRAHRRKSEIRSFREGEMVTIAGNSMIDLTGAQMAGEKGSLEVVVLGGRAWVRVPEDWVVETKDSVTAGALNNRASQASSESARKLKLEAVILGGRLDVTH